MGLPAMCTVQRRREAGLSAEICLPLWRSHATVAMESSIVLGAEVPVHPSLKGGNDVEQICF
jgi:hypothetical protein